LIFPCRIIPSLFSERISDHVSNVKHWFYAKGNGTEKILDWLVRQDEYASGAVRQQQRRLLQGGAASSDGSATPRPRESGFWFAVSLVLEQLEGVLQGHSAWLEEVGRKPMGSAPASSVDALDRSDLLLINALGGSTTCIDRPPVLCFDVCFPCSAFSRALASGQPSDPGLTPIPGDLSDLLPMFVDGASDELFSRDPSELSPSDAWRHIMMAGHCSALIRSAIHHSVGGCGCG